MTAPTFRETRKFLGPSWLTDGDGQLVGWSLDVVKDAFIERLRLGLLARFPQNGPNGQTAPDDALAAIGRDRRIVRGINEASVTYAARLLRWLDDWKTAGNPFAVMKQLSAYVGKAATFRTVDARGNWYSYSGSAFAPSQVVLNAANWDWDGDIYALAHWSRFWVIIYPNGIWLPGPYNFNPAAPLFGDGRYTFGTTATPEQVATVKAIVSDWKPAGTRCVNIIIAFDNTSFNPLTARDGAGLPDGNWGHWSKTVNRVRVPARLSTARYWDGV
jgi:hypothetical protein